MNKPYAKYVLVVVILLLLSSIGTAPLLAKQKGLTETHQQSNEETDNSDCFCDYQQNEQILKEGNQPLMTSAEDEEPVFGNRYEFNEFTIVDGWANDDFLEYKITCDSNEYGDTIVVHLQTGLAEDLTTIDYHDYINITLVGEYDDGDELQGIQEHYRLNNNNQQDVQGLSDSIYISYVPLELEEIYILLKATDSTPFLTEGTWVEIRDSDEDIQIYQQAGDCSFNDNLDAYQDGKGLGSLGQAWAFADGYHLSYKNFLRYRTDVSMYNYKGFSPLKNTGQRKADIFCGVSWAGTCDVNSVWPTGCGDWGYHIGTGLSTETPLYGNKIACQRLAKDGTSLEEDFMENVAETLLIDVIPELAEELAGEAILPPFAGEIFTILQFTIMMFDTDESVSGSRIIKYEDVPLEPDEYYSLWTKLTLMARAGGTASSYVNFKYSNDPFITESKENKHQKGAWLHNILIYYHPEDAPVIELQKPQEHTLLAKDNSIQFKTRATGGTAPYTIKLEQKTKNQTGHTIATTTLNTWNTIQDGTTLTYYTSTLPVGEHLIVVTVTDSNGAIDSDYEVIEILEPPETPTIEISIPKAHVYDPYLLRWSKENRAVEYEIKESTDGGSTWQSISTQNWNFTPLVQTTFGTYQYQVKAYDKIGQPSPSWSNIVSITIQSKPLSAPLVKNMSSSHGSGQKYGLQWEYLPLTAGYEVEEYQWFNVTSATEDTIERKLIQNISFGPHHEDERIQVYYDTEYNKTFVKFKTINFTHSITEKTTYEYRVAGRKADGTLGNWSRRQTTEIIPPPQSAPRLLHFTNSVAKNVYYSLYWMGRVSDAEWYRIEEDTSTSFNPSSPNYTQRLAGSLAEGVTFYHVPPSTTTYYYRIRAENAGGPGPWSNVVNRTITVNAKPEKPILHASSLVVSSGEPFNLSWNAVNGERGYLLDESKHGPYNFTQNDLWGVGHYSKKIVKTCEDSTEYSYRVRSFSPDGGYGDWSNIVTVLVIGTKAPETPVLYDPGRFSASHQAYDLEWKVTTDNAYIFIEEDTDSSFSNPYRWGSVDSSDTKLSDTHSKITKTESESANYYYRIRVKNGHGYSHWSNIVSMQILVPDCDQLGWSIPVAPPVITTPAPFATINSSQPFWINWTSVLDASFYILEEGEFYGGICQFSGNEVYNGPNTSVQLMRPQSMMNTLCYRVKAGNLCGLTGFDSVLPSIQLTLIPIGGGGGSSGDGEPHDDSGQFGTIIDLFHGSFAGIQRLEEKLTDPQFGHLIENRFDSIDVDGSDGQDQEGEHGFIDRLGTIIRDFNGDNTLDLIKIEAGGIVKVLDETGSTIVELSGIGSPSGVCTGDYDGDEQVDLLVSNYDDDTVVVYDASGTLIDMITTGVQTPQGVAFGDYNNDGVNDVAIAQGSTGTVSIRSVTGAFIRNITQLDHPQAVCIQDYNGDGYQDLLVTCADNSQEVFFGTVDQPGYLYNVTTYDPYNTIINDTARNLPLPWKSQLDMCEVYYEQVLIKLMGSLGTEVGDFNNDGVLELAVVEGPEVLIYDKDGSILQIYAGLPALPRDVALGDLTGNDECNVAITMENNEIIVFDNQGIPVDILTGFEDPRGIDIGDWNGDQQNEFIVAQADRITIETMNTMLEEITGVVNPQGAYIQPGEGGNESIAYAAWLEDWNDNTPHIGIRYQQSPPYQPHTPSPSDETKQVSLHPSLCWTGGDPDDSVLYNIAVGDQFTLETITSDLSETTYPLADLELNTSYYWQITAHDAQGHTISSPLWKFTTRSNTAPDTPHTPLPSNEAITVPVSSEISWSCSDPEDDNLIYDVYLGTHPTMLTQVQSQSSVMNYNPSILEYDTTYYWKVIAQDSFGYTTSSPLWSFTTGQPESIIPVGYWRFNEGTGSTTEDETTYDNQGTLNGATWTPRGDDYALHFDGNADVTVSHNDSIDITEPFTVEAWIKLTGSNPNYAIVDKYQYISGSDERGFTFYVSNGKLRLSVYSEGTQDGAMGTSELRDDTWHHVKAVCTGNQILLYVDGGLEIETSSTLLPLSTTNHLGIGKRLCGWGGYMPFFGDIDNVRLTRINNPPATPSNPTPLHGASEIPVDITLSWVCSDTDYSDQITYNVYFGTSQPLQLYALNHPLTSVNLPTLHYDTTYQWQVIAKDSYGATTPGPLWQFTTEFPTSPPDIVYVDDDYHDGGDNDGHLWGYDAFDSIQTGINAVNASGLVTVLSGLYQEQVTIDKPVTLFGEDKDTVIIDGQNNGNVLISTADHVDLSQLTILNAGTEYSGVVLDGTNNNTLSDLALTGNGNGILLQGSSYTQISDIYAYENSDDGIELYQGSNYNTIENSTFYENGAAVFIYTSQYNIVQYNTIINSTGFGIQLYDGADYNTILQNTITGTTREIDPNEPVYGDAICLFYYSSQPIQGCLIENNELSDNIRGITLRQTQDSTIRNNIIQNSTEIGIKLYGGANNNLLYQNIILYNFIQAEDEGSNQWDNEYPSGGNFWSDYAGFDLFHGADQSEPGSDGIGDTPYNISGGFNQDRYPQMDALFTPNLYITTNLGVFGQSTNASFAYGLNENGQVVGSSGEEYGLQGAFHWENGVLTPLGTLGGLWSRAEAINETGAITGSSHTPLWRVRGFMDDNHLIEPSDELGVLPNGNVSYAHDINNQGYIVGTSYVEPHQWQPPHAFLYHNTTGMNDLGVLTGYNSSVAYAINNNNWVTGTCAITDDYGMHSQGFLWEETMGMIPLETLPGTLNSYANDINDQGQIVGYSHTDTTQQAYLWENSNVIELSNLGGPKIIARAINNHGQIVGSALTSEGAFHAVLWENDEIYDLNSLLLPDTEWELTEAYDINNNGQIIGHGTYQGHVRAFLLDPYSQPQVWITEPMATSYLYEPEWEIAVITEQNITVKAKDIGGSHDIVSTLFEYSDDGQTWYEIGVDTFGGFEGIIHDEYEHTWWGPNNRVGDEGWSVFWNITLLPEGDYYLKATMTDELGTTGENIRPVHIDRVEPLPTLISPANLDAVSGTVNFTATTLADDIVQMDVYLINANYVEEGKGGPSSGWFRQTGLGGATQTKPGTCAPTAAANGLAGQQDNKIYPEGRAGDDQALADELEKIMGTTDKGTNAWKKNTTDGTYETDNIGDGLKSWLEKRKVGCSNDTGYEVKTYRTKVKVTPGKPDQVVPGSNTITFQAYNNELRKNQSIILWGSYFDWNYSTNPPTIEPNGHAHALTGKGANSKESDMGPGTHEIDVLDTNGQTCTTTWYPMGDGQGNTYSAFEYPPGSQKWFVILGMWAVSPKGRGGGSSSTGVGVDQDPSDGLAISVDTTSPTMGLTDGFYTFVVETTDAQGFIGSETTTLLIDNTKPVSTITPPSGDITQLTPLLLHADDGQGAGVDSIHYSIYHNGLWYLEDQRENDSIEFTLQDIDIYEGQVDIEYYAMDAAGNIEEIKSATYVVIPEGPAPWITQPMAMDFLYEENWTIAPVTDDIITIKVKNLIHGQPIINTTFAYSDDGITWIPIGYDDTEA
ncbi:MAG: DUF3466 family protein, partial [Candidatus Lokiarchaeota archaeon]|nr:DUF3466 family protein [Candidatus Lokiarchaeota archaeon]